MRVPRYAPSSPSSFICHITQTASAFAASASQLRTSAQSAQILQEAHKASNLSARLANPVKHGVTIASSGKQMWTLNGFHAADEGSAEMFTEAGGERRYVHGRIRY